MLRSCHQTFFFFFSFALHGGGLSTPENMVCLDTGDVKARRSAPCFKSLAILVTETFLSLSRSPAVPRWVKFNPLDWRGVGFRLISPRPSARYTYNINDAFPWPFDMSLKLSNRRISMTLSQRLFGSRKAFSVKGISVFFPLPDFHDL